MFTARFCDESEERCDVWSMSDNCITGDETSLTQKRCLIYCRICRASRMYLISSLVSDDICQLLITFSNSLDPYQAQQNVRPDQNPYYLTL